MKAPELAEQLSQVFGGGGSARADQGYDGPPSMMPGLDPVQMRSVDTPAPDAADPKARAQNAANNAAARAAGGGDGIAVGNSDDVSISAVEESNALLVRATPMQWESIRRTIERLDTMPLQVHIEAQVVSVTLSGALQYGVSWFLDNAISDEADLPYPTGRNSFGSYSSSVAPAEGFGNVLTWTFLGRSAAGIIQALDNVSDVRLLQTPSVFTQNNKEATLNVGSRIPISSVTFNPTNGSSNDGTYSQVQYLETGTILKVRPRITRDGMVFLDIVQEVSAPQAANTADANGNVRIDTNKVKTSAVVPSGETIMLAGLIKDGTSKTSSGIPGLSRIPVIGGLFGQQGTSTNREELVVLITPTVVRNPQDARDLTDEYSRRFRAMDPLYNPTAK
jgi:general secretion pathway protein D